MFAILQTKHFLNNKKEKSMLEKGKSFVTFARAKQYIRFCETSAYYLSQGEISRPTFKVLDLSSVKNKKFYNEWMQKNYSEKNELFKI